MSMPEPCSVLQKVCWREIMSRVQWNSSYNTETKTKERRSDPTKKERLTEEEKDSSHSRSLFMKKLSVKTN
jgi:hypothetical protein